MTLPPPLSTESIFILAFQGEAGPVPSLVVWEEDLGVSSPWSRFPLRTHRTGLPSKA